MNLLSLLRERNEKGFHIGRPFEFRKNADLAHGSSGRAVAWRSGDLLRLGSSKLDDFKFWIKSELISDNNSILMDLAAFFGFAALRPKALRAAGLQIERQLDF